MSPRPFERPATIALPGDDGLALEGLHVPTTGPPAGGALIAPPHPLYGGSMENPVVTEIAHACERADFVSLRFNWRGVGASGGHPSGEAADADTDYTAALEFLAESVDAPLAACGYSFGAAAAARCATRVGGVAVRVKRLLLVAPPPGMLDVEALRGFGGRVLIVAGECDRLAPPDALAPLCDGLRRGQLHVVPDADHFFGTGLRALCRAVADWLVGADA